MRAEWKGFTEGRWTNEINVRSFIKHNYTPYDGDESFLVGPTQNTKDLWEQVLELTRQERAAGGVIDGEITVAVRDAVIDGKPIHVGDYLALSGGDVVSVSATAEDAVLDMLSNTDIELCEIITLFVGEHVSEECRASLTEKLKEAYEDFEIVVYNGGQEVYDYLIAIE